MYTSRPIEHRELEHNTDPVIPEGRYPLYPCDIRKYKFKQFTRPNVDDRLQRQVVTGVPYDIDALAEIDQDAQAMATGARLFPDLSSGNMGGGPGTSSLRDDEDVNIEKEMMLRQQMLARASAALERMPGLSTTDRAKLRENLLNQILGVSTLKPFTMMKGDGTFKETETELLRAALGEGITVDPAKLIPALVEAMAKHEMEKQLGTFTIEKPRASGPVRSEVEVPRGYALPVQKFPVHPEEKTTPAAEESESAVPGYFKRAVVKLPPEVQAYVKEKELNDVKSVKELNDPALKKGEKIWDAVRTEGQRHFLAKSVRGKITIHETLQKAKTWLTKNNK